MDIFTLIMIMNGNPNAVIDLRNKMHFVNLVRTVGHHKSQIDNTSNQNSDK